MAAEDPAHTTAVLDDAVLDLVGRLGGKSEPEFLDRLIAMFLESALTLLAELKRALADCDVLALRHASQTLKSCSATIGALSTCPALQRAGNDGANRCGARCGHSARRDRSRIPLRSSGSDQPLSPTITGQSFGRLASAS